MSLLINCQEISKAFGAGPLFENVSFTISEGERLALIGPNGAGKSTLLQILAGLQEPDSGVRSVRKLLRIGYVPQETSFDPETKVGDLLEPEILGKAGFLDPEQRAGSLSGGWKKRLAIAQQLSREPDVLMLDEPTNHLDLQAIFWLEKLLLNASFACIVVSHDRYFLENIATDTAELSRQYTDGLFRVKGSYSEFLLRREDLLLAQSKHQEALANQVRREVEWLRRGAKARTTKSKARIDTAGKLIEELADVSARNQTGTARIDFQSSDRKTKKLIELTGAQKQIGNQVLFSDLNLRLSPGRRVGLVGANGSGKSTILKLLRGDLQPDRGTVDRAENVRVVYFDQNRAQLDPAVTLRKALVSHGDSVIYQDRPVHVMSWAKRFLFRAEQLEMPVGRLSGGEKARVLIAKLMLEPADVLLLDEPTNDLDIPTLEVLEENLTEFPGALVLVTHDRFMLDRVSNLVVGLDGEGGVQTFADYGQWEQSLTSRTKPARTTEKEAPRPEPTAAPARKRLSYMESREWDTIETRIAEAEAILETRKAALADPAVNTNPSRLVIAYRELETAQNEVDVAYARWAELEAKLA